MCVCVCMCIYMYTDMVKWIICIKTYINLGSLMLILHL